MLKKFPTISITSLATSVAVKINKNIAKRKKTTYPTLAMKTITQFSFLQLLPEDTKDLLSTMKTNKASGPSSIPTEILH